MYFYKCNKFVQFVQNKYKTGFGFLKSSFRDWRLLAASFSPHGRVPHAPYPGPWDGVLPAFMCFPQHACGSTILLPCSLPAAHSTAGSLWPRPAARNWNVAESATKICRCLFLPVSPSRLLAVDASDIGWGAALFFCRPLSLWIVHFGVVLRLRATFPLGPCSLWVDGLAPDSTFHNPCCNQSTTGDCGVRFWPCRGFPPYGTTPAFGWLPTHK